MKICEYCEKGTLQLKVVDYTVSIYNQSFIRVGKTPVSACNHCGEEFLDLHSLEEVNKSALKKLYGQYIDSPNKLPGTIAGWMRIKMRISRDDLTENTQELKNCEQNNFLIPESVAKKLLQNIVNF